MKILQVRFKNLNSLAGEWHIDFTDPAYAEDGIFAITGPTGSGKTTILDAICLALYGRTPRLDSISASSNEIMTRQTGECFSEVIFSIGSERYRCHWSQRKSRKKADGKLQAATREFVDDRSGVVLEQKLKTVTTAVIEKTGMTFDQFTRSMLLAQGGFSAFLQAPADERAPILEQITGTEIYSRISVKVHEMRGTQRTELEKLQAANRSIQLLSEEDALALNAQITEQEAQRVVVVGQKTSAQTALAWLGRISGLEKELKVLDQRAEEFDARRNAFSADQLKLEWAEKARGLQVGWAQLVSARNQFSLDTNALKIAEEQRPELDAQFEEARIARDSAREQLIQRRTEQKNAAEIIKAVRELDLHIQAKQQSAKDLELYSQVLAKKTGETEVLCEMQKAKIQAELASIQQAADYLVVKACDASLSENLTALREKFKDLTARFSSEEKTLTSLKEARAELDKLTSIRKEKTATYERQKAAIQVADKHIAETSAALDVLLQGRELEQLQLELDDSRARNRLFIDLKASLQDLGSTELEIAAKRAEKAEVKLSRGKRGADLISAETERDHCEEHFQNAELKLEMIRRMADMEEQRRLLMEGHPCPLCGSIDHPYSIGKIVQPTKAEAEVDQAKFRFEKAQTAVFAVEKRLVLIKQTGKELGSRIAELEARRSVQQKQVEALCAPLALAAKDVSIKVINGLLNESTLQMQECMDRVEAVNLAAKEKAAAQVEGDAVQSAFRFSEIAVAAATAEVDKQALLCDQTQKRTSEWAAEIAELKTALLGQLSAYGMDALSDDAFDQLDARSRAWKTAMETQAKGELTLMSLRGELEHFRSVVMEIRELQAEQQQKQADLKIELDTLKQQRCELFGDKASDVEEAAWVERLGGAERAQERAAQTFVELDKNRAALLLEMDRLAKLQAEHAVSVAELEQDFLAKRAANGFVDEAQYQSALLAEDEYIYLAQIAETLTKEGAEIATLRDSKTTQLDAERAKGITDQSNDEMAVTLQSALDKESAVVEMIGGLRQQLKNDEDARAKCAGQLDTISKQQKVVDRWDRLHALIGSGDGKKFRNFAQGLTFELVIAQANRQLRKMSDRYLLVHDGKQPLDLNVIDDYQGGEIRSTKNLSGGESFIVSLALALGLSHMASRNVRVDSLFLDEGFGTLDEEALEIALETLAGLQEEGKLIGVISHVPLLKERIRTQIQVEPQSGGRSLIRGVGIN